MNSRLLGRNSHLLMLILAILLMNVRVAEARVDWPEGTKGIIAKAGWFITSIAFGVVLAGAIMHAYRTVVDRRAILSDLEVGYQIRESRKWLAYTAWIRAEHSTAHPLERAVAARIFDLERQLFGVPAPARPLFPRLFSCLFPSTLPIRLFGAAKNGGSNTSLSVGDDSINGNNRRDKGKAVERSHIPDLKTSTVDGAIFATISNKIDGRIAAHCSVLSAWSTITPQDFTTHNIATKYGATHSIATKYGGKKVTDHKVSMNKPAENARSAIISKIDGKIAAHCSVSSAWSTITPKDFITHNIATKYGLKKATDRSVSMKKPAEIARKRPNHHVIAPPPKIYTAAISFDQDNIPAGSTTPNYDHFTQPGGLGRYKNEEIKPNEF